MKIFIPEKARQQNIGGGWSFSRNIQESLKNKVEFVEDWDECDICLIPGSSLIPYNEEQVMCSNLRDRGKKIVLRVDGIPEDWRNEGFGWEQLSQYAEDANLIIYQSEFIQNTVGSLLKKKGVIIYNGVDKDIFRPKGEKLPKFGNPAILHILARRDPLKRWDEVIVRFRNFKLKHPEVAITFIGNYPNNITRYRFGMLSLEHNKDWRHYDMIEDRKKLAMEMRSVDYIAYPSFADPCPNTLIEAMSCGCRPLWINDYGGQKEIVDRWDEIDWGRERMGNEYLEQFNKLLKK